MYHVSVRRWCGHACLGQRFAIVRFRHVEHSRQYRFGRSSQIDRLLAQAAVVSAIVVLWFCPLLTFWFAVWSEGRELSMVGCTLCMAVGLLALALPVGYYWPRHWEISGHVYRRLGVWWFKRLTPDGDFIVRKVRRLVPDYRAIGGRGGLSAFELQTRRSEQGHLIMLLVTVPAVLYAAYNGWLVIAAWLLIGNLIINFYPIMVQRYNRARTHRILGRMANASV